VWLPGRAVARAASRHLPAGTAPLVRGPRAAARSVARGLRRLGFDAQPDGGAPGRAADALVLLGRVDGDGAARAAAALGDGGRLVVCRVRPTGRRRAMDLTSWLAHAGFVGIGQQRAAGLLPVHTTFGILRRLPD
jgi:hypothetical protein